MRVSGWIYIVLLLAVITCPVLAADYAILTGTQSGKGVAYLVSVNGSSVSSVDRYDFAAGSGLRGVAGFGNLAYIADHDGRSLQVLRATTNSLFSAGSVGNIGNGPNDVAVDAGHIYVANHGEAYMRRLDRSTLSIDATIATIPPSGSQCVTTYDGGAIVGATSSNGAGIMGRISDTGGYSQISIGLPPWVFGAPRQTTVGWIGSTPIARSYTAVINTYIEDENLPDPYGGVIVMDPDSGAVLTDLSFRTQNFQPTGVAVVKQSASWVLAVAGYDSANNGWLRRYTLDADGRATADSYNQSLGAGRTHLLALSASGDYLFASSSEGTTPLQVFNVSSGVWSSAGSLMLTGFEGWGVAAITPLQVPEPASILALAAGLGTVVVRRRFNKA